MYYNGYHGDCSETYLVGEVDSEAEVLCVIAEQCRNVAIDCCGPGVVFQSIGENIRLVHVRHNTRINVC